MRKSLMVAGVVGIAVGVGGCSLFESSCGRVASSICTIPGEEDSCTFFRRLARDNQLAQDTCEKIAPDAVAYARDPNSLLLKGKWLVHRLAMTAIGFVGEATKPTPGQKLDRALDKAGEAAEKAGEAAREGAAAVKDAVDGAVDSASK